MQTTTTTTAAEAPRAQPTLTPLRDAREIAELVANEQFNELADSELLEIVGVAGAELEGLNAEAEKLDADAQHASAKFKDAPSPAAHSAREVSAQQATNARAAHAAAVQRHAPLFAEHSLRRRRARYAELKGTELPTRMDPIAAATCAAFAAFIATLREQGAALAAALQAHNATVGERKALEREFGTGGTLSPVDFTEGVQRLNEVLQAQLGALEGMMQEHGQGVRLYFASGYAVPFIGAQLRFPHNPDRVR